MKRTITCLIIVFFCAPSGFAQTKRNNRSAIPTPETAGGKCAVTVRNDLIPNRGVVVVGCDSFGITATYIAIGTDGKPKQMYGPSGGGIVVFDTRMNLIFKWEACSACGGFFSHFAGTQKVQGHNALMVKLVNGPRLDAGGTAEPTVPLYFNGREFKFAEIPR